jgi:hypothetical protein
MEVVQVDGLATHGCSELCVDVPRGRGEALTGARRGHAARLAARDRPDLPPGRWAPPGGHYQQYRVLQRHGLPG